LDRAGVEKLMPPGLVQRQASSAYNVFLFAQL
jgi:hypothetical protein